MKHCASCNFSYAYCLNHIIKVKKNKILVLNILLTYCYFLSFTDNGVSMFLWIGHNVAADWVQQVFGVQSAAQIDIDKVSTLYSIVFTINIQTRPLDKRA